MEFFLYKTALNSKFFLLFLEETVVVKCIIDQKELNSSLFILTLKKSQSAGPEGKGRFHTIRDIKK